MDKRELTDQLKLAAGRLGFELAGVCPAVEPPSLDRFREWLKRGYAGEMRFLSDGNREHPDTVLNGSKSLIMLAMSYRTSDPSPAVCGHGRVSRYAWGSVDYHDLIRERLNQLAEHLGNLCPGALVRGVVDTAPLLEREFAQSAGLGWIGKNTLLLNRSLGSWFFLAALLTDQELEYDAPVETNHCGRCRACLDACPTQAFVGPWVLDASRCISYLTIELRGPIPEDLRPGMGEWVFGCDICQDVCPWNRKAAPSREAGFVPIPNQNPLALGELFSLDDAQFRSRFRQSPLWRARRRGLLRNAAIVLGNQRPSWAADALARGIKDAEPMVREACGWALGRIASDRAREVLKRAIEIEEDPVIRLSMARALQQAQAASGESEP